MPTALYGLYMLTPRVVEENAQRRGVLVEDVMTRKPITFGPEAEVGQIAQAMHDKHINRVVIVEGGEVVGIVSRHDIIRAMADGNSLG